MLRTYSKVKRPTIDGANAPGTVATTLLKLISWPVHGKHNATSASLRSGEVCVCVCVVLFVCEEVQDRMVVVTNALAYATRRSSLAKCVLNNGAINKIREGD